MSGALFLIAGVADSWLRIEFAISGECEKGGSYEAKLLPFLVIVWIVL